MTTIDFETEECCECGVVFQVTEEFQRNREEDCQTFYCPNGHGQSYEMDEDSDVAKIKRLESELSKVKTEVRSLKCRLLLFSAVRKLLFWMK